MVNLLPPRRGCWCEAGRGGAIDRGTAAAARAAPGDTAHGVGEERLPSPLLPCRRYRAAVPLPIARRRCSCAPRPPTFAAPRCLNPRGSGREGAPRPRPGVLEAAAGDMAGGRPELGKGRGGRRAGREEGTALGGRRALLLA